LLHGTVATDFRDLSTYPLKEDSAAIAISESSNSADLFRLPENAPSLRVLALPDRDRTC